MAKPRLTVVQESKTGKNEKFKDNTTGKVITSSQAIKLVKQGEYKDYAVSKDKNGCEYIRRKADGNENTNLG